MGISDSSRSIGLQRMCKDDYPSQSSRRTGLALLRVLTLALFDTRRPNLLTNLPRGQSIGATASGIFPADLGNAGILECGLHRANRAIGKAPETRSHTKSSVVSITYGQKLAPGACYSRTGPRNPSAGRNPMTSLNLLTPWGQNEPSPISGHSPHDL